MNGICIVLYVNALYSQHLLNKPLTNRESNKLMLFPSQLFFSIVENLLRVYAVYYQYGYIIIHQFNKKRIVLQGFKLFPCDGVETTDSFYRLISALGKSSVSCPLKPSDSTPLKHSTMPP